MRKPLLLIGLAFLVTLAGCDSSDPPEMYNLTVEASPSEGGSVSGSGEYEEGTEVDVSAEPADGWTFVRWEGALSGSEPQQTVTLDSDQTTTAVFERREYTLTVNTEGEGTVGEEVVQQPQATTETDYDGGTVVELTAQPADGWVFAGWQGALSTSENPAQITVDSEKSVTAVFVRAYTVNVSTEGNGSVALSPEMERYPAGTEVEFTAIPEDGWEFVRWEGDLSESENPQSLTVDGETSVTAIFQEGQYAVSASVEGDGSVERSPQQDTYTFGTEVQFTATAADGSAFIEWNGALTGSENPQTLTVAGDASVTAVFQTYDEALTFQQAGGIFIGGRVNQARLALYSDLPEPVSLMRFTLLDAEGNVVTENTEGTTIEPGSGVSINISFGIPPTQEEFSNYTTEWEVEYNGDTYVKEAEVGQRDSSFPSSTSKSVSRELEIEVEGSR